MEQEASSTANCWRASLYSPSPAWALYHGDQEPETLSDHDSLIVNIAVVVKVG